MDLRMDKVDRISALPEGILQHIISFLSFKQAVQTSTLSKIWKQAWLTYPILNVDRTDKDPERRRVILTYLGQTLLKRDMEMISITKLVLKMELTSYEASYIEQSLQYAVRGCKLELQSRVNLPSLRNLSLAQIDASDQVIDYVVSGCPLIEFLRIDDCLELKSLKLFNLDKLKKIKVSFNEKLERVEINASNVHSLSITYTVTPCWINVVLCKNLKQLKLWSLSITDEWLCNEISELLLLEYLDVACCMNLESILISSSRLKTLFIGGCINLVEAKIEAPSLSAFSYQGDMISFSFNALALSEVDLYFYTDDSDAEWLFKFIEALAKFHQFSEVINLKIDSIEHMLVPRALRQTLMPPLSGTKHLNFRNSYACLRFPIMEVVDSLLWISPHLETLSIEIGSRNKIFLQEKLPVAANPAPSLVGNIA
ncbi:F-box domain containing protein [Melia azedarach]|uniref:F-box domain containing protein n=1 Tax=Melia azedarach TaxID=155640 RepID=A0ACC1Y2I9_MELAZ|nr:F-box domain containing protein [Melia azedarach]